MLTLPIKKKWFDMIAAGIKKEEYREIKPYYDARLLNLFGAIWVANELIQGEVVPEEIRRDPEQTIAFRNGYSSKAPLLVVSCRLEARTGREEWGAVPKTRYYVLKIIEVLATIQ